MTFKFSSTNAVIKMRLIERLNCRKLVIFSYLFQASIAKCYQLELDLSRVSPVDYSQLDLHPLSHCGNELITAGDQLSELPRQILLDNRTYKNQDKKQRAEIRAIKAASCFLDDSL